MLPPHSPDCKALVVCGFMGFYMTTPARLPARFLRSGISPRGVLSRSEVSDRDRPIDIGLDPSAYAKPAP